MAIHRTNISFESKDQKDKYLRYATALGSARGEALTLSSLIRELLDKQMKEEPVRMPTIRRRKAATKKEETKTAK